MQSTTKTIGETHYRLPDGIRALHPRGDRIVVEVDEDNLSAEPQGLLWTPKPEEPRQSVGTVIAVGPGLTTKIGKVWRLIAPTVKVGDRVAFSRYGHTKIGNLRVLSEQSLHGILE